MAKMFSPGAVVRLKSKSDLQYVVLPDNDDTPKDDVRVVYELNNGIVYGYLPQIALCLVDAMPAYTSRR